MNFNGDQFVRRNNSLICFIQSLNIWVRAGLESQIFCSWQNLDNLTEKFRFFLSVWPINTSVAGQFLSEYLKIVSKILSKVSIHEENKPTLLNIFCRLNCIWIKLNALLAELLFVSALFCEYAAQNFIRAISYVLYNFIE